MIIDRELLESAKTGKCRIGQRYLIKYLEGNKITRTQGVKAKCYDCLGMGESKECDSIECPLYPFSPFKTAVSEKSEYIATESEL